MANTNTIETEGGSFSLTVRDDLPEFFTDGISQILMGNPISKLTFHSVTHPSNTSDGKLEERNAILLLTIPTPVLLEVCKNILSTAQSSIDVLSDVGKKNEARIMKILNDVQINQIPAKDQLSQLPE